MARTSMENVVENFSHMPKEQMMEYAEKFSEGDKNLKKLLIKMWNNNIQTYASCAGHDASEAELLFGHMKPITDPYIFFDVRELSDEQQRILYKSLIITSKRLNLIKNFNFTLDNHVGFERHGLTIYFKNHNNVFSVLNDILDSVVEETILTRLRAVLTNTIIKEKLTKEEEDFIESLIEANSISINDLDEAMKDCSKEEKFSSIRLEYENSDKMSIDIRDRVNVCWYSLNNEGMFYSVGVAEGYYTKDEYVEDLYYRYYNGKVVSTTKKEGIEGLTELVYDRPLNYNTNYNYKKFKDIKVKAEQMVSSGKSL